MIGGSAVGVKNRSPEAVGAEAADELIKGLDEGGCVDEVKDFAITGFTSNAHAFS